MKRVISVLLMTCLLTFSAVTIASASCYAYAGNNCEHVVKYSGEVQ